MKIRKVMFNGLSTNVIMAIKLWRTLGEIMGGGGGGQFVLLNNS